MADTLVEAKTTVLSPTAVRWTREDCEVFERTGLLKSRYELVEGVINRFGQNYAHGNMVRMLVAWLFAAFGEDYVFSQTPIDFRPEDNPTSKPEPDAILLACPANELTANPIPSDIRLLIEAADTTAANDLTTKAGLYARAGIAEYWVVVLPERSVYVHRQPEDGAYTLVTKHLETEQVATLAGSDRPVLISQLLPPDTAGQL